MPTRDRRGFLKAGATLGTTLIASPVPLPPRLREEPGSDLRRVRSGDRVQVLAPGRVMLQDHRQPSGSGRPFHVVGTGIVWMSVGIRRMCHAPRSLGLPGGPGDRDVRGDLFPDERPVEQVPVVGDEEVVVGVGERTTKPVAPGFVKRTSWPPSPSASPRRRAA
jgi:hypothetical protein